MRTAIAVALGLLLLPFAVPTAPAAACPSVGGPGSVVVEVPAGSLARVEFDGDVDWWDFRVTLGVLYGTAGVDALRTERALGYVLMDEFEYGRIAVSASHVEVGVGDDRTRPLGEETGCGVAAASWSPFWGAFDGHHVYDVFGASEADLPLRLALPASVANLTVTYGTSTRVSLDDMRCVGGSAMVQAPPARVEAAALCQQDLLAHGPLFAAYAPAGSQASWLTSHGRVGFATGGGLVRASAFSFHGAEVTSAAGSASDHMGIFGVVAQRPG